jgi:RNA polymerase sigma-70 factor (ECF subfamily)
MPEGYREIVLLHDLEGFTHEEIGQLLGVEPGTSKSQLSRGRRWLRRTLRDSRGD